MKMTSEAKEWFDEKRKLVQTGLSGVFSETTFGSYKLIFEFDSLDSLFKGRDALRDLLEKSPEPQFTEARTGRELRLEKELKSLIEATHPIIRKPELNSEESALYDAVLKAREAIDA